MLAWVFKFKDELLTLEVGHIRPDIGVQGIHYHLAVRRTGDLHSPVDQTRRWWRAFPRVVLANVLGLRKEVEKVALIELSLSDHSSLKELFPALVECAVEESKENAGILAENVSVLVIEVSKDVDLAKN